MSKGEAATSHASTMLARQEYEKMPPVEPTRPTVPPSATVVDGTGSVDVIDNF
jgi:hypothetical protein